MSLFLNVEQNYQFWKVMVSINLRIVCQKQTMSRPRVCQDERVLSMQHFGKLENLQDISHGVLGYSVTNIFRYRTKGEFCKKFYYVI